jgi:hypothetical protein
VCGWSAPVYSCSKRLYSQERWLDYTLTRSGKSAVVSRRQVQSRMRTCTHTVGPTYSHRWQWWVTKSHASVYWEQESILMGLEASIWNLVAMTVWVTGVAFTHVKVHRPWMTWSAACFARARCRRPAHTVRGRHVWTRSPRRQISPSGIRGLNRFEAPLGGGTPVRGTAFASVCGSS